MPGSASTNLKLPMGAVFIAVVKERRFLIDAETDLASWPDYERDINQIIDSFRVPM
jgi:hypothetical protein